MERKRFFGRTSVTLILAAVVVHASQTLLLAQTTGGIIGTVVDETGAVLPGVDVVARHTGTDAELSTVTTAHGAFRLPEVPIGIYAVTARLTGFQTVIRQNVEVLTGRTVDVRLTLKVGEIADAVEVIATTPTVQTNSSEVQETIDSRAMRELPLNGRDPLQLAVLTPGVIFTTSGVRTTPEQGGFGNSRGFTVNGLPPTDNNYRLDGGKYRNLNTGGSPTVPNPDTLQEFTLKSSNYSAQYGEAGGVVQFSTRSGTNELHGSLFEFFRHDKLDARPFFADQKQPFVRNQFGGTIGGPILRDKTFVFGSLQFERKEGSPQVNRLTVPTPAERQGDFSGQPPIIDPLTGEPFPGNQIPESRLSPIGAELMSLYPLAPDGTDTLFAPKQADRDDDQLLIRADHHVTDRDHLSARWFFNNQDAQRDTGSIPGVFALASFDNNLVGINYTRVHSSNLVFTASFNYTRTETTLAPVTPFTLQDLGANIPPGNLPFVPGMRTIVSGFTRFFSGSFLNIDPKILEWRAHASWTKGDHLLQFGADVERDTQTYQATSASVIRFTGDRTSSPEMPQSGAALADLLLGLPREITVEGVAPQSLAENKFAFWIQDDWKIHPNLTVNLGLRYDPWLPPTDELRPLAGLLPGVQSTVAPDAPPGLVFAGAGVSDFPDRGKIYASDLNNWAPRLGFAWDLGGDAKTVLRGGYGIFYRSLLLNIIRDTAFRIPFRGALLRVSDPPSLADPLAGEPAAAQFPFEPPPTSELQNFTFIRPVDTGALDPNETSGQTHSWNLTIERELFENLSLSVGYVGNRALNVSQGMEGNPAVFGPGATAANEDDRRIYPGLGSIRFRTDSFGESNYNGLQVRVVRRSGTGLNILANYTYSKVIDINSIGSLGGATLRNPFDPEQDRGPADFDVRHRANVSVIYPLPAPANNDGFLGQMLSHWQVNTIVNLQSGTPFTVKAGRNRSLSGANTDNADLIGDPTLDNRTIERDFNTEAFALPALGTFGTAGRNILYSRGMATVDFAFFKDVPITEGLRWQFRFEAFNLFNRANFKAPVSNLSNQNFGRILETEDPRIIQLGVKVIF